MFRVYSIFYFDKIWWAPSEQEKTVSNSSDTRTAQIRNLIPVDPARNCGERSLPSLNGTVANLPCEPQEDNKNKKNEIQKLCICSTPHDDTKTNNEKQNLTLNNERTRSVTPSSTHKWRTLHHRQVSLNMSSKDILSPIITHTSANDFSFSPRRILSRAMSRAASVKSFSSPNPSSSTNKSFFLENASVKKRSFTKKLKRAFSIHQ
ncbi:hypothetical protein K501DRAFT_269791 [Backusella circina FSU 941]|nr:hypothetical protein K501DRAFT_269791 [Backusella circina FSU 941]